MSNQQPSGSQSSNRPSRSNLYLDFSKSYEQYYDRQSGERRPVQSGFVSSTSWTTGDPTWYKAQTVYATSNISSGPTQESRVTCSQKETGNHLLKELLND